MVPKINAFLPRLASADPSWPSAASSPVSALCTVFHGSITALVVRPATRVEPRMAPSTMRKNPLPLTVLLQPGSSRKLPLSTNSAPRVPDMLAGSSRFGSRINSGARRNKTRESARRSPRWTRSWRSFAMTCTAKLWTGPCRSTNDVDARLTSPSSTCARAASTVNRPCASPRRAVSDSDLSPSIIRLWRRISPAYERWCGSIGPVTGMRSPAVPTRSTASFNSKAAGKNPMVRP